MRMKRALWIIIFAAAGCRIGPRVSNFIPATSPAGVNSFVSVRGRLYQGELLAVDDSALLVLTKEGVVRIPYPAVTTATFDQVRRDASATNFRGTFKERLRLVSRFPQGLTPELLSALMRARQQNELIRVNAQGGESRHSILLRARAATTLYQNRSAAIAAGYRPVGPDTPDMGEHWVSPRILVDGKLDYDKPAVLTYVMINGQVRLGGVAYAIPLGVGEPAPELPDDLTWHDHAGTVEDELTHGPHSHKSAAESRVAMLHAWVWIDNPRGPFSEENWALPFLRLNLAVPEKFDVASARALSLLSGGDEYLLARVRSMETDPRGAAAMNSRVAAARADVRTLIDEMNGGEVNVAALARLGEIWNGMTADVASLSTKPRREQLQALLGTNARP